MTTSTTDQDDVTGLDLGTRRVEYDERDAILYALAVGARADQLDLIFERGLRVLPTFGLAAGLWAADELSARGLIDPADALHGAQRLELRAPLPRSGALELTARIANAWDKGSAALYDVEVECAELRATYSIFAPGRGGWGGERGPRTPEPPAGPAARRARVATLPIQAALYRLTGDRHLIHVDPEAARAIGQPRPIMHGLCTLAMAALTLADLHGAHPCDLRELSARFAAPVLPGEEIEVAAWDPGPDGVTPFTAETAAGTVLSGGRVAFGG